MATVNEYSPRRDPKLAMLARMPGFGGYRDRDLVPLAAAVEERLVPAGALVVTEGDRNDEVFLVVQGKAGVRVAGEHIGVVVPGEFVGEMSVIDHDRCSATVQAITPLRLFAVSAESFARLFQEAAVARAVARTLSHRLRRAEAAAVAAAHAGLLGSNDE